MGSSQMLGFGSIPDLFLLVWREFSGFELIFRLISCLWSTNVSDALTLNFSLSKLLPCNQGSPTHQSSVHRVTGNLSFQNKNTIELWVQDTTNIRRLKNWSINVIDYYSMEIINTLAGSHLNWIPHKFNSEIQNQSMKRLKSISKFELSKLWIFMEMPSKSQGSLHWPLFSTTLSDGHFTIWSISSWSWIKITSSEPTCHQSDFRRNSSDELHTRPPSWRIFEHKRPDWSVHALDPTGPRKSSNPVNFLKSNQATT